MSSIWKNSHQKLHVFIVTSISVIFGVLDTDAGSELQQSEIKMEPSKNIVVVFHQILVFVEVGER